LQDVGALSAQHPALSKDAGNELWIEAGANLRLPHFGQNPPLALRAIALAPTQTVVDGLGVQIVQRVKAAFLARVDEIRVEGGRPRLPPEPARKRYRRVLYCDTDADLRRLWVLEAKGRQGLTQVLGRQLAKLHLRTGRARGASCCEANE
jgi:hypothetical protein